MFVIIFQDRFSRQSVADMLYWYYNIACFLFKMSRVWEGPCPAKWILCILFTVENTVVTDCFQGHDSNKLCSYNITTAMKKRRVNFANLKWVMSQVTSSPSQLGPQGKPNPGPVTLSLRSFNELTWGRVDCRPSRLDCTAILNLQYHQMRSMHICLWCD